MTTPTAVAGRRPRRWAPALVLLLGLTAIPSGLVVLAAAPAHAETGAMIQPVSGRVTGILSNRCGTIDSDHYGVDIAGNGGTAIGAAYPGTVTSTAFTAGGGNTVTVSHASGYSTRYLHLAAPAAVTVGQQVSQGHTLGIVGSTGNSTGPHLHFEIRRHGAVYNLASGYSCGGTVTKGARINSSFPDLPVADRIPDRALVVRTNGTLAAKETLNGPVHELATGISKVTADRDRIAVIDSSGTARVKPGGLTAQWVTLFNNARDVAVDGDRYVVLRTDGTVWAKDGLFSTQWVLIATNTTVIDAADGRIGVITNGNADVKEGGLHGTWVTVATGASDLSLDGSRIGVVQGGIVSVKEGPLNALWQQQAPGTRVVVEGYRIGILNGGNVDVKEGALNALWARVATGATDFDIAGNRIAVVSGGWARVKEPALNSLFVNIIVDARQVALANQ